MPTEAQFGVDLAEITMGIDAFARREAGGERLVPLFAGEGLVRARCFATWDEISDSLADLARRAADLPADPSRAFRQAMIASLDMGARILAGQSIPYADKVATLVAAPPGEIDPDILDSCRAEIEAALTRLGYVHGTLAERFARWLDEGALDPAHLESTYRDLLLTAQERTSARIFDAGDTTMTLTPVRGVAYTARCGFSARRMWLNVDLRHTRAALKHLVCHEVFPGHVTHLLATRHAVATARAPADALLVAANAVPGCIQEGIAEHAIDLIDWIEDDHDRLYAALRRLRAAAQTNAAWRLMVENHPAETVADDLRHIAFGQEAWVQGRLALAQDKFHGPFIASYFAGAEAVQAARAAFGPDRTRSLLDALYGDIHSIDSLALASAAPASQTGSR